MAKLTDAVESHVTRILSDTGYLCRNLLGWNYDEMMDPTSRKKVRVNVGNGGVRADGPHKEMCDFLDEQRSHYKVLLAPRESYKSTILQGFVTRQILRDPNVRILYGMRTDEQVFKKARAIKRCLERREVIELFGEQRSDFWQDLSFTVAGRTQPNLQEPTFSTFTLKSLPTGGHFDYIILDDFVDDKDYLTSESSEKAEELVKMCDPLGTGAGYTILVGTRYHDEDIYGPRINDPEWESLVIDSGVSIEERDGGWVLVGQPRFAHQTIDYLMGKLRRMQYQKFLSQYMNVVPQGLHQPFRREDFRSVRWGLDMSSLSGYVLTDTAVSEKDKACYSVIAYVGMDEAGHAYLLDLRVGRWPPPIFVENFFEILGSWRQRVNHVGEVFEDIGLNQVFYAILYDESRRRKQRLNLIKVRRGRNDAKKDRIQRLEVRFRNKAFTVVDTVPRVYQDIGGTKVLFDPEGWVDPKSGVKLPAGELVDQFIRFPVYAYCDIPDALADIDAFDGVTKTRYVTYRRPMNRQSPESVTQKRQRVSADRAWGRDSGDWWDKVVGA